MRLKQWLRLKADTLDPVSQGWVIVMGGNLGRLALGFAASILLARALGPADFGVYAVLGAAMAIGGVIADLGLTVTEVKRVAAVWSRRPDLAYGRGHAATWLRLISATFFFIIAASFAFPISRQLLGLSDVPGAPALFILAMAGMVAVTISGSVSTLLQATNQFGRLSSMNLINAGSTTVIAVILFATTRLNLLSALILMGIGTTIITAIAGYRLLPSGWSLWRPPGLSSLKQEGSALFQFSRWMWVATLFSVIVMQIDVIMVGRLTSVTVAGLYGLALNLSRKADIANQSLHTASLPTASSLADWTAIRQYLRRSLKRSGLISLGLLLVMPLVEPFIRVFYGPEFVAAAGLTRVLLVVVIIDVLSTPIVLLVFPLDRPKLYAASTAIQAFVLLSLAALLIPSMGAPGAGMAKIFARLSGLALLLWRLPLRRLAARSQNLRVNNGGLDQKE